MAVFIGVYLSLVIFMSGMSIKFGDRLSFYLILQLPFILYFVSIWKKENIFFPKRMTLIWIGFSIFDITSAFLSTDKQLSIERLLLYQSSFLLCVYFYNQKKTLTPIIENLILIFSYIFTISYFLKDLILKNTDYVEFNNVFNLFFPAIQINNHLGIWLGMTIIIYYFRNKLALLASFILVYLTTFSRSSYLALIVTSSIYFLKKNILPIVVMSATILILGIVILIPRGEITSDRGQFIKEAYLGFIDRPLFGYGSGNFTAISRRYAYVSKGVFASTSHNLLLDILSGSGLIAFVFYVWFLYLVIKIGQRNIFYWIFIYLLIAFNFSYIFAMPVLILIFYLTIGLSHQEKYEFRIRKLGFLYSFLIFVISIYLAYSELLYYKGDFIRSIAIYPYRKEAYESLVTQTPTQNIGEINYILSSYKRNFPDLFEPHNFSGQTYNRIEEYKHALRDYLVVFENGTGFNPTIAYEIQLLYLKLNKPVKAYEFSKIFISSILNNPNKYRHMFNSTYDFCIKTNKFFLDKAACF